MNNKSQTIDEDLRAMCEAVIDELHDNPEDVFEEALEIEYITDAKREVLGAKIIVTTGGPLIYIDTQERTVEGHWGPEEVSLSYYDGRTAAAQIEDLVEERWALA